MKKGKLEYGRHVLVPDPSYRDQFVFSDEAKHVLEIVDRVDSGRTVLLYTKSLAPLLLECSERGLKVRWVITVEGELTIIRGNK